jgi:hypothetical protein
MSDDLLLPGEDIAAWGVRTGRFRPDRAAHWRERMASERQHIAASGGDPATPSQVEAEIRALYPACTAEAAPITPVYARGPAPAGPSRLEQLERALFGPTRKQLWAEQDAAAEAALEAAEEQEAIAASAGLTDDEYRAIFGDDS